VTNLLPYIVFSHCNDFSLVTAWWNRPFWNEPTPSTSSTAGARDNFTAAVAARKAEETWAIMVKGGVKWNTKRKDNDISTSSLEGWK